jgi:helicase
LTVGTVNELGGRTDLAAVGPGGAVPAAGPWAAARDAFAAQWDGLEELPEDDGDAYAPVGELVPAEWAALLPHPSFNPAQAAAGPVVGEGTGHLVVAPTGAGKTPIARRRPGHRSARGPGA